MPTMKDYSCYLFDVDGTLIDTAELIYQCFLYSCRTFGGMTISRDKVIEHIGLPLRKQFEVYLGKLDNDKAEKMAAAHMQYQLSIYKDYLSLFPHVAEALNGLKGRGKRIAAVTSRKQQTARLYLEETGILANFDVLVTPEMTTSHKPDAAPVLKALEILGCAPCDALFIGDSIYDIQCGARAGVDTAFVTWSFSTASSLAQTPTYIISDLNELVSLT